MTAAPTDLPAYSLTEIEDADYGPAMQALSDKQKRFVINVVELGGGPSKFTECAKRAGYTADSPGSLGQTVYRLVHSDKIQAALEEEARRRLKTGMVQAVSGLLALAERCADTDPKVALKAYEAILNRTGLPSQSEQKVTVEHKLSDQELLNRVNKLGGSLGVDLSKLLPPPKTVETSPLPVIDAEFVEVEEDPWRV